MPAKPDDSVTDPLIAPTSRRRTRPRGHAARDALRLSYSPGVRCQAAGALAWLERHTALCSAKPRECQPTPPIRPGPPLLPVFFAMQSPASLCAGEGGSVSVAVKSLYPQAGCLGHPEPGMSIDPAQLNGWRNGWHRIK